MSDRVVDVAAAPDPVGAVFAAHRRRDLIALRTSGTSGSPRPVVRTTRSWFDSFDHVTRLLVMGPDSRVWLPGPLTSTMNLFAAVHAADLGATVQREARHATHAVLTPTALSRATAGGTDLADVHVLVAGDRLSPALHRAAVERGAQEVSHYYGAAELSFVAWGPHSGDLRPFPGVEIDDTDGLLWARSPYVLLRYDGPGGPATRRPDGFVTVGDRGALEGGRVHVHGRGSDTVVTAGATVVVADVETALEAATGSRVHVVGVPHPDLGQVLCGVVASRDDVADLRRSAREVLDPAQRPRRWFVVRHPPLTRAGKLDRDRLAAELTSS